MWKLILHIGTSMKGPGFLGAWKYLARWSVQMLPRVLPQDCTLLAALLHIFKISSFLFLPLGAESLLSCKAGFHLFPASTWQTLNLLSRKPCVLGCSPAILMHSGAQRGLGCLKGTKTFPPLGASSIRECTLHPICYYNVIWMRHQTHCLLLQASAMYQHVSASHQISLRCFGQAMWNLGLQCMSIFLLHSYICLLLWAAVDAN